MEATINVRPGVLAETAHQRDALDPAAVRVRPTLDAEIIGRLQRMGEAINEDLLGQLTVLFVNNANSQIIELHRALVTGDSEAVVQSAHGLRGASATLGATELASLCASLETDGAALGRLGSDFLLESIEFELERVRVALTSLPAPQ